MEFYLAAGGEVEMFFRFRLGDYQSSSHARIGTCNGDGLDFSTSRVFPDDKFRKSRLLSWLCSKEFTVGDSVQGG